MTSEKFQTRFRAAIFTAFCIWCVLCLSAYVIAQSERRRVKVVDYEAREIARIQKRPAPEIKYRDWDGPLRFLPYVSNMAGSAFNAMFEKNTFGKALFRLLHGLGGAAIAAAILFIATILGRRICRLLRLTATALNRPERFAVELAVGTAAFGIIFFLLGLVYLYRWWAILGVLAVIACGCRRELLETGRRFPGMLRGLGGIFRDRLGVIFACIGFLGVLTAIPVALSPAWSLDALVYHLAVPKAYLAEGGIHEIPWSIYSYFPMNAEMFFLAALALGGEMAAKFMHLAVGLAAAAGIYGYARRYVGRGMATAAAASFIAAPSVIWLLGFAYIDLFVSLLIVASVISFTAYAERGNGSWILILGVLTAGLIGTKYTGLPIMVLFAFGIFVLLWRKGVSSGTAVKALARFGLIAVLAGSPWLVRNAAWTGNPIFPFVWGENEYWDEIERQCHLRFIKNYGYGNRDNPLERYGMMPWNMSIKAALMKYPTDNYDGVIGPILLILLPLIIGVKKGGGLRAAAFLMLGGFLMFAFTTHQMRFFLPWLGPLMVLGMAAASRAGPRYAGVAVASAAAVALVNIFIGFVLVHQHNPLKYVLGVEDRDAFLERKLKGEYRLYRAMNNRLGPDTRTLLVQAGNLGYWADRPFIHDSFFESRTLRRICIEGKTPKGVMEGLKKLGVTHIGAQFRFLDRDIRYEPEAFAPLREFLKNYTREVFREGTMVIFEIRAEVRKH